MTHRRRFLLLVLLTAGLLGLRPAGAQSLDVRVLGRAVGAAEAQPLAGAWVYAVDAGVGAQTDAAGEAVLPGVTAGAVTVQKAGWTGAVRQVAGAPLTVTLVQGDADGNGRLDVRDVAVLVDALGTTDADAAWEPAYDVDADGAVTRADLEAVAAQTGATGDPAAYRLIDDAEDPDPLTELPRGSFWQTLSDASFNGGSSTTTPPSLSRVEATAGGVGGSDYAVRYQYELGAAFQFRFALLRALMTGDDTVGIDAGAYTGLEFWLKGNGVPLVVSLKAGPTDDDFHEYEVRIDAAPEAWTRYRLSFADDFRQPGWGQEESIDAVLADLEAVQFKTVSGETGEQGEVWVDNLQFARAGAAEVSGRLAGQVVDDAGAPVPFVRVRLDGTLVRTLLTDADGRFEADVPAGAVTVTAERAGFADAEAAVVVTSAEPASVTLAMTPVVPAEKPVSTGPVRLFDGALQTDFDGDGAYDPFFVQGAAFSVAPIGSFGGVSDPRVYDRAAAWVDTLGANTIRTYSGLDPYMMDLAAERGVRVILGYWVDYAADLRDPGTRAAILDDFRSFVGRFKDHPALLMWTLGNEQNYQNGDDAAWYDLAQELAVAAYEEEGAAYHPVTVNNGGVFNIGDAALRADDASLTYMDAWASNIYEFDLGAGFFATYRGRTSKPVVLTEWGIDALDNRTKTEYETVQADFDVANWQQIVAAADVALGGTVFEFTDEWWKAGDPFSHDYGGYPTGAHPDGYSNEEWWGLVAVTPDTDGDGLDEWRARAAYYALQALWRTD